MHHVPKKQDRSKTVNYVTNRTAQLGL